MCLHQSSPAAHGHHTYLVVIPTYSVVTVATHLHHGVQGHAGRVPQVRRRQVAQQREGGGLAAELQQQHAGDVVQALVVVDRACGAGGEGVWVWVGGTDRGEGGDRGKGASGEEEA